MFQSIAPTTIRSLTLAAIMLGAALAAPAVAGETSGVELRLAEDPENVTLLVAAGREYLGKAQGGDGEALTKAEQYLDRAIALAPDEPKILVLHGSVLALKGRDAKLPVMKMRHVQNGLKEMDRAVELAPTDFEIRYQRGAYCLNLPDIFHRAGTAVEDFEHLIMMAELAPETVTAEELAGIRINLAQAKLKTGEVDEARALLESVREAMPDTEQAGRADALLAKIGGEG